MGTVEGVNVYVLSYAPSYERSSVGGFDWYLTSDALMKGLSDWIGVEPREFVARDYRIMTLRFPEGTSMEEIALFMDTAEALNVVDPPDPSSEVAKAFEAWKARRPAPDPDVEWVVTVKRTTWTYHDEVVRAPASWDEHMVIQAAERRVNFSASVYGDEDAEDTCSAKRREEFEQVDKCNLDNGLVLR
jgi:hypothetical protein